MKRIGIIGLGNMGIGLARNIIKSGFELTGFDLRTERLEMLEKLGGSGTQSPAAVGEKSDTVFVMVLNGKEAKTVCAGDSGLTSTMKPGQPSSSPQPSSQLRCEKSSNCSTLQTSD